MSKSRSLLFREDGRSSEVAQDNIEDFTGREGIWAKGVHLHLLESGKDCYFLDTGVDNSGKLIEGNLKHHNEDKLFVFKGGYEISVEIKTLPEGHNRFYTFKVFSVAQCIKHNACIVVPQLNFFYLLPPDMLRHIQKNCYPKFFYPFSRYHKVHQIYRGEFKACLEKGMFFRKEWKPKAQAFILENEYRLTKPKKT